MAGEVTIPRVGLQEQVQGHLQRVHTSGDRAKAAQKVGTKANDGAERIAFRQRIIRPAKSSSENIRGPIDRTEARAKVQYTLEWSTLTDFELHHLLSPVHHLRRLMGSNFLDALNLCEGV